MAPAPMAAATQGWSTLPLSPQHLPSHPGASAPDKVDAADPPPLAVLARGPGPRPRARPAAGAPGEDVRQQPFTGENLVGVEPVHAQAARRSEVLNSS